jgi:hypothetical protein
MRDGNDPEPSRVEIVDPCKPYGLDALAFQGLYNRCFVVGDRFESGLMAMSVGLGALLVKHGDDLKGSDKTVPWIRSCISPGYNCVLYQKMRELSAQECMARWTTIQAVESGWVEGNGPRLLWHVEQSSHSYYR